MCSSCSSTGLRVTCLTACDNEQCCFTIDINKRLVFNSSLCWLFKKWWHSWLFGKCSKSITYIFFYNDHIPILYKNLTKCFLMTFTPQQSRASQACTATFTHRFLPRVASRLQWVHCGIQMHKLSNVYPSLASIFMLQSNNSVSQSYQRVCEPGNTVQAWNYRTSTGWAPLWESLGSFVAMTLPHNTHTRQMCRIHPQPSWNSTLSSVKFAAFYFPNISFSQPEVKTPSRTFRSWRRWMVFLS